MAGDGLFRLISFWAVASMVIFLTTFVQTVLDVLAAAEQRAATTAREMQHRVQNALTLVQAIARQTFRTSDNLAGAQDVFSARLAALGRAQALIDEGVDENVTVATLIKTALTPFDTGQFALSGPALFLPKDVGVSFALLLHELATNAIKYGALSSAAGRVAITWQKETPVQRPPRLERAIWPGCNPAIADRLWFQTAPRRVSSRARRCEHRV